MGLPLQLCPALDREALVIAEQFLTPPRAATGAVVVKIVCLRAALALAEIGDGSLIDRSPSLQR